MAAPNEAEGKPDDLYIHIPLDLLHDVSTYQCPATVVIDMADKMASSTRRSVGGFSRSRKTSHADIPRPSRSVIATSRADDARLKEFSVANNVHWSLQNGMVSSGNDRSMEQGDSPRQQTCPHTNFADVIDMVAKANEQQTDGLDTAVLAELRSSPCHMHHRHQQSKHVPAHRQQHQQLLYSTNYHGGQVANAPLSVRSGSSGRYEALESQLQVERTKTFHRDIQAGLKQSYNRPTLPDEMAPRDFVTSWLQHGSEPSGKSHFPGIAKQATHNTDRPPPNPGRRKQTLAPLEITNSSKPPKPIQQKAAKVSHLSE